MANAIAASGPSREGSDLFASLKDFSITAPTDPVQLFRLLKLLVAMDGLEALLARMDFSEATPATIFHSVLQRAPLPTELAAAREGSDPRAQFRQALLSREFQSEVIRLFLLAFPEKRRIFFVHIPKCAGTDLEAHLAPRYVSIPLAITSPAWTSSKRLMDFVARLALLADVTDRILVYGHLPFNAYVRRIGVRPGDHVFTVVRDPIDIMISQANYNVGLLTKDPEAKRPDTRQVMERLNLDRLPNPMPDKLLHEFALRCLLDQNVARPNRICAQLGNGTADGAMLNLISQDVEVTDVARYRRWLSERWSIDSKSQHNRSLPILRRDDMMPHLDYLRSQTEQDQRVFDTVVRALDRSECASLRGSALA